MTDTVVVFCPRCGIQGEYGIVGDSYLFCTHCNDDVDIPEDVELPSMDPEAYEDT